MDALLPGLTLSVDPPARVGVQPFGTTGVRLKLIVPQAALLLLVTDSVKLAESPGLIDVWEGESVTTGGVCVHAGA